MTITAATIADVPELSALINGAYRGESSKKGWTTEADILGGIRTSESALINLINKPGATVLTSRNKQHQLTGCVYLQQEPNTFYLGMLTVDPLLQAAGIGKKLLYTAEEYAKKEAADNISMTVISVRHELIAWYERHGYKKTGETKPFPTDPAFGIPKQPLEFVVLKKSI